jgi:hypothetical protein
LLALAILLGSWSASTPAQAQAGTTCVVIQPNATAGKDAYIKEDKVDERRGGDSELRVKSENGHLNRSLLQFDLSSLPSGASVSSATLSLYVKDASGGAVTINARSVTNSWVESEVTWKARNKAANLLWTTAGGDFGAVVSSTSVDNTKDVWRSWNVTSLAANWVATPASNYGVILEAAVTDPKTEKKFKSSDDGTATERPKLEVCYTTGVTIQPDNSGIGVPGQTKTYQHVVTVGNITSAINLSSSSNQGFTTRIYADLNSDLVPDGGPISATPSIGPNATYTIVVQIDVPFSAPNGAIDQTTVIATAQVNNAQDSAVDSTRVGQPLVVQPNFSKNAVAGSVIFYGHQIINNSSAPMSVNVTASSSQGWTVLLWDDLNKNGVHETSNPNEPALTSPISLSPGQAQWVVVEVQVLAGAAAGTIDQTTLSGSAVGQPGVSDTAVDTTKVFVNAPPVIDGKYDDIYSQSPDAEEVCYVANGILFGKLASFYQPSGNSVYFVLAIDKDFVDNTYGTNAIGWPNGHTFGNLTGSDHAEFQGRDANGNLVLDFKVDYLTSSTGTPSGYDSLGVTGGEGKMITFPYGSAASIQAWATSLDYSLNSTGYCSGGTCPATPVNLLVNSPPTNALYQPQAPYQNWLYDVIYEVQVDKAAFGPNGFGAMSVPYIHASPSKLGTNTIIPAPAPCPGEIGDTVWNDANGNGIKDGAEVGIANVQLKLYQDNGDGVFDPATDTLKGIKTTDANGLYLFQNLPAGDYFVQVVDSTVPAGASLTTNNNPTPIINLGEGQSYLDADFGYIFNAGAIGDFVWNDVNANGVQNAGEPGLANITVKLYTGAGAFLGGTATSTSGYYLFPNRPAGTYRVEVMKPAGYVFSPQDQGGDDTKDSDVITATGFTAVFTLTAGQQKLDIDAGMYQPAPPPTAVVGDYVWEDLNGDGIQDPNEPGIANVPVSIFYSITNTLATSTQTDASGYYSFTVLAGTYYLQFGQPSGYVFTTPHQGTDENKDSDASPATGRTDPFVLSAGVVDLAWDAGLYQPATVGNFVWDDLDSNGLQDANEPGIDGVQVVLFTANVVTPTNFTFTSSGGYYTFTNVAPGDYYVEFGLPQDYVYTSWQQGGNPDIDSDAIPPAGLTSLFTLVSGETNLTIDAGMYRPAAIGDTVYFDDDRSELQDNGEVGIAGIIVYLYTAFPSGLPFNFVAYEITDDMGKYVFDDLRAGMYRVIVPAANEGNPLLSNLEPVSPTVNYQVVSLPAGTRNMDVDWGYAGFGVIRGIVFLDLNSSGSQDPGEPGMANVQVCLYGDISNPPDGIPDFVPAAQLACTFTDQFGAYSFNNYLAGGYIVGQTTPAGYDPTTPITKTLSLVVSQGAGVSDNNNFGNIVPPDYSLVKRLVTPDPVRSGQNVRFEITMVNTGTITVTVMPLVDTFDTTYLAFAGANPPQSSISGGTVTWNDLTTSFGRDLGPGGRFTVTVDFVARADTTLLPNGQTINTATVQNAKGDPDGSGPVGDVITFESKSATAPVRINNPTAAVVVERKAIVLQDGVQLHWVTTDESSIIGFNVLREGTAGNQTMLNDWLIEAEKAGQSQGATYEYLDAAGASGGYRYLLEVVLADGRRELLDLPTVGPGQMNLYLPAVNR